MGAIFEGCQEVIIWLGHTDEDRQTIEEGITRLREHRDAWEDMEEDEDEDEEEEGYDEDEAGFETSAILKPLTFCTSSLPISISSICHALSRR
jgi:hypothetical protein